MKSFFFKSFLVTACFVSWQMLVGCNNNSTEKISNQAKGETVKQTDLQLTHQWDKTFAQSPKVNHSKVTFKNRFGIELAADLYIPKDTSLQVNGKFPAIAVSGPFGAVKEQSSGLYAQTMAEKGFLTLAFDPSFTGESGGAPRYVASPDINTEDFSAAVDFLATRDDVDAERIGIIGICGWGGIALNAAAVDPRIKAIVASTMYDMTRVNANGYFDADNNKEKRNVLRRALAAQRLKDFKTGTYESAGGVIDPLPENAPQFVKDYHAYYKMPRGYHKRSLNSNNGWNKTSAISFLNAKFLAYTNEIDNPVLIIHGENAHSRYFGEDAFTYMTGQQGEPGKSRTVGNKELLIIPGATHVDLYDNLEKIPFNKLEEFFKENLK